MSSDVYFESTALWKILLTILTLIWTLLCMSSDVYNEVTDVFKTFLAMTALIIFLSGVISYVLFETTAVCKTFLTMVTNVGFFGMDFNVYLESILLCKACVTMFALIWSLPDMSSDVYFELAAVCKVFLAISTLIEGLLFGVSSKVKLEITPL